MKAKLIAIGKCERCGSEYVRPYSCSHAVCGCCNPSPTFVPLQPALILPERLYKRYEQISKLAGVSVEELVNKVLEKAAKEVIEKEEFECSKPGILVKRTLII